MNKHGIDVKASIGAVLMMLFALIACVGFIAAFGDNITDWLG